MKIELTKADLAEMAQREAKDDFRLLLRWADEQIEGPSIFPDLEAEPEPAVTPATVEIAPPPPLVAEPVTETPVTEEQAPAEQTADVTEEPASVEPQDESDVPSEPQA